MSAGTVVAMKGSSGGDVLPFRGSRDEPLLSKRQLSGELGYSTRWVDYRVREGMPYVQARGQKRFRLSEVLKWLDERG